MHRQAARFVEQGTITKEEELETPKNVLNVNAAGVGQGRWIGESENENVERRPLTTNTQTESDKTTKLCAARLDARHHARSRSE